jgi:hypothetical protein
VKEIPTAWREEKQITKTCDENIFQKIFVGLLSGGANV